jgi:hypothetical protein
MPAELAENTTKPATTITEPHVVAMAQAPIKAQKPTEEEVEVAEVFLVPAASPDTTQLPAVLPTTASPLPLIALIGFLSLVTAGVMRFAAVTAS